MECPKNKTGRKRIYTEEERKDRVRYNSRQYNARNADKIREKRTRYIKKNWNKYLHRVAKSSAKARGIDFSITPEDVVVPTHCVYTGLELTKIIGEYKGKIETNASIDRIDNSKGYIPGNVQVISNIANKLKNNASIELLVKFATGVLKQHCPEKT